jgi:hypothetical protein
VNVRIQNLAPSSFRSAGVSGICLDPRFRDGVMKFGRPLDIPVLAMILLSARVWAFLFLDFLCRLIAPSFLRGEGGDTPPTWLT